MLTRLTDDPAVDTEPAWSPDGKSIYFTSDRAGGPQIYKLEIAQPKRVERITFGSRYNARPRVSPDGKKLAFVTREGGNYRIAVQDLASGTVSVLSHGALDESPSFAPNGAVDHLRRARWRDRHAADRVGRWSGHAAVEVGPGRIARAGVGTVPALRVELEAPAGVAGGTVW